MMVLKLIFVHLILILRCSSEVIYDEEVVTDYQGYNYGGSGDILEKNYYGNGEEYNYVSEITTESPRIFQYHKYNENKTVNKVHQHHDALIALYGSEESVYASVYRDLHNPDYLSLYKVKLNIKEALQDPNKNSNLDSSQIYEVQEAIDAIDKRMEELEVVIEDSWFMKTLSVQGDELNKILNAKKVYKHLNEISRKITEGDWNCNNGYLVNLWKDVVNDCTSEDQCGDDNLHDAVEGIVGIAMAIENVTIHRGRYFDPNGVFRRNKIRLLFMVSQKRNRDYAIKVMGSVQELEDLVQHILCNQLTLNVVETVLVKFTSPPKSKNRFIIQTPFASSMVANTDELLTLVDIQTALGEITSDVTSVYSDLGSTRSGLPNLGQHILDSYMDLVDNAVNINSTEIWAQMSLDDVNEKLHHMLLSNEQYVGTVSDVILGKDEMEEPRNYTLEKDSLSVSMSRVELQKNTPTIAQFQYEDTYIWTDDMSDLDQSKGNDLKVYTLRYKSWSQMIREILLKHSDMATNSSEELDIESHSRHSRSIEPAVVEITRNKSFIGKGGVVSLSTKQNGVKRSVPVTYWIGFDDKSFSNFTRLSEKSQSHFCLSCEYLQPETVTWESRGCHVVDADNKGVTCKCNHTTNFAAFMMPAEMMFDITEQESTILDIMSIVGSILSVVGLLISLLVFYLVRNLVRNERFRAHTNLSLALLGVHLLFLFGDFFLRDDTTCLVSTVILHYFLLASFMWMLVEGIFLYLYVVQVFLRSKIASYNWMYAVGWFVPAFIVAIAAGYGIPHDLYVMESDEYRKTKLENNVHCPDGTFVFPPEKIRGVDMEDSDIQKYERCWLSTSSWMIWSFLIPAILVLVFNTIIMCKTLKICVKSLKTSSQIRSRNKMYNNERSSPPRSSSSSRYAPGHVSSSEDQQHFGTYDRLHGQARYSNSQGLSTPNRVPIVVSTSPCLLQVTTEEEESNKNMIDKADNNSESSTENVTISYTTNSLHPCGNDKSEIPSRYQSPSADSSRIYNNRTSSVMYRNSVSHSPKSVVKSQSFNNKMAPLEASEKVHFFQDAKTAVKGAIVLLPILGVPWVCGFLAHLSQVLTMLFIILNSTQGFAIFIVYCLFNGEVRRAIHRRMVKRSMKYAVDSGRRRTSSTSTVARSFLRFGRRRSTVTTTA